MSATSIHFSDSGLQTGQQHPLSGSQLVGTVLDIHTDTEIFRFEFSFGCRKRRDVILQHCPMIIMNCQQFCIAGNEVNPKSCNMLQSNYIRRILKSIKIVYCSCFSAWPSNWRAKKQTSGMTMFPMAFKRCLSVSVCTGHSHRSRRGFDFGCHPRWGQDGKMSWSISFLPCRHRHDLCISYVISLNAQERHSHRYKNAFETIDMFQLKMCTSKKQKPLRQIKKKVRWRQTWNKALKEC